MSNVLQTPVNSIKVINTGIKVLFVADESAIVPRYEWNVLKEERRMLEKDTEGGWSCSADQMQSNQDGSSSGSYREIYICVGLTRDVGISA